MFEDGAGPIRIDMSYWAMSQTLGQMARIILEEQVGINVAITDEDDLATSSIDGLRRVSPGCWPLDYDTDVHMQPCKTGGRPYAHMFFACHPRYIPGGIAPYSDMIGLDAVSRPAAEEFDYVGEEALCLHPDFYSRVLRESGYDLSYFRFYDFNFFNASQFFSTIADVVRLAGTSPYDCATEGEETYTVTQFQATYVDMYVELTQDTHGVEFRASDGIRVAKCYHGWWFAPSCRENPEQCIPVVLPFSYLGNAIMQWSAFYNMPLAIGSFNMSDKSLVKRITGGANVLFYEELELPRDRKSVV